jgi:hypothetical protein
MDSFIMQIVISYPDDAAYKQIIRLVRGETMLAPLNP